MLTLTPTLAVVTILTLLNPTNPNRNSKTMKLSSFDEQVHDNHPDDAVLTNKLHVGLLLAISLR